MRRGGGLWKELCVKEETIVIIEFIAGYLLLIIIQLQFFILRKFLIFFMSSIINIQIFTKIKKYDNYNLGSKADGYLTVK